ncbi:MAG: NUDIX hydrolase [Sphingomonas sp. SCN 67-18]|uniref:NUDIX hydrolase n=1 Tax=uncultured Sphingomonas sp. TaxID=158754 RepID=UPI000869C25B|nr:NUDIX domain-containing protein [Sphingomonas sp. SCN 67-18]ODU20433.1 MAG: NUDIX hydrolase [Sphingomonas sp. SCN 67-18]
MTQSPAIPAATLILMRDAAETPPAILMVERARSMVFAGGALVFPGGRIDPGDREIAATPALIRSVGEIEPEDAAARVAAIRETIEESGIAPGFVRSPDHGLLAALRAEMAAGGDFGTLIAGHGLTIDLDLLVPFARWRPSFKESRIFDTRFYVARAPADAPEAVVDATENVRLFWASAAAVLADCDSGNGHVIFPTRRNLERLAGLAGFDQAAADARRHSVETITPWIEERDGQRCLCIPEGRGYPVTAEPLAAAMRG